MAKPQVFRRKADIGPRPTDFGVPMCRPQVYSRDLLLLTPRVYSARSAEMLSQKVNADRCFRHSVSESFQRRTNPSLLVINPHLGRPLPTHLLTQAHLTCPFLPETLVCVRQLLYWEVRTEVNMYTRSNCSLPNDHFKGTVSTNNRYQRLMRLTNPCGSSHIRIKKVFDEPQASSQCDRGQPDQAL